MKKFQFKQKRHMITAVCMLVGLMVLTTSVYANYDNASGYSNYKSALKNLLLETDNVTLDADVEAVGAFFNHFGELAVVLLEYGLALRHAALGVDDLLLELFLCHGGLLSSWPGQSRGS